MTSALTTIMVRGDTSTNWTAANPVLALCELGYETGTRKLKFGDGVTAWNTLPYFSTGSGGGGGLSDGDYGDVVVSSGGTVLSIDSAVISAFGRTLVDDASAAAARTTLGLGSVDNTADSAKNVATAGALATARNIAITGDLAWNLNFSGSGNVTAAGTLATVNATTGSFGGAATVPQISVNGKGLVTSVTAVGIAAPWAGITGIPAAVSSLTGTNTGDQTITLTGDVTGSGTGPFATTIGAGKVTLAMQANMATASVVYRKTAGTGPPEVQTLATLKTDLGLTGINSGDQTTITGNSGSATVLQTPRTISITGKATAAGGTFNGSADLALNITAVTLAAGDIPNITESQVTNLVTDLAAKAPLASPQFTGLASFAQPNPTAIAATATLTIAQILTLIITTSGTTAISLTLPTGTLTDVGITPALAINQAFEWYLINTGTSAAAVTMVAGTAHTIVGNAVTNIGTTSRWLTRKTAANTFVTYRIA